MDLGTLSEHERLVLVGLVKLVVHADREVTPAERVVLVRLQGAVGAEAWNEAVRTARERYASIDQLEHDARAVDRPEVKLAVHEVLVELAGSDEIIDAEAHVLHWVVQEWGLDDPEAPISGGESSIKSQDDEFVMLAGDDE